MAGKISSVLVIGLGRVGLLVGTLLHQQGYRVTGLDRQATKDYPFTTRKGSI